MKINKLEEVTMLALQGKLTQNKVIKESLGEDREAEIKKLLDKCKQQLWQIGDQIFNNLVSSDNLELRKPYRDAYKEIAHTASELGDQISDIQENNIYKGKDLNTIDKKEFEQLSPQSQLYSIVNYFSGKDVSIVTFPLEYILGLQWLDKDDYEALLMEFLKNNSTEETYSIWYEAIDKDGDTEPIDLADEDYLRSLMLDALNYMYMEHNGDPSKADILEELLETAYDNIDKNIYNTIYDYCVSKNINLMNYSPENMYDDEHI